MKKLLSLAPVLFISAFAFAEEECQVVNQVMVKTVGSGPRLVRCENSIVGGLTTRGGFYEDELISFLEKNKDDKELFSALEQIEIGRDYESAVQTLKDFTKQNGKAVNIIGGPNDGEALKKISKKINDSSGITAQIEAQAAEEAETKKRRNAPIKMDMQTLASLTQSNGKVAKTLDLAKCRSLNGAEQKLKVLKVKFKDGEEGLIVPFSGRSIGNNTFEFTSPNYGKGPGGLQFVDKPVTRKLKFEGGRIFWLGTDGKQYEVESFSSWTSQEGLGFIRPMNTAPGSSYDTCSYAKLLHLDNPPQNSGDDSSDYNDDHGEEAVK